MPIEMFSVQDVLADPQLIPVGLLVTVPPPAPAAGGVIVVTVSPTGDAVAKYAVQVLAALIATAAMEVVPEQSPSHLTNTEPGSGWASSATAVPLAKICVQDVLADPQLIPAGLLVTVPLPILATVSVLVCCVIPRPAKKAKDVRVRTMVRSFFTAVTP